MPRTGRIVKFELDAGGCSVDQLRTGLRLSGLGEDKAKDMLPRNAWARACKHLKDGRVISPVREDDSNIYFQFTREYLSGNKLNYNYEAILSLNKTTGVVESTDDPQLAAKAKTLVDAEIPQRSKSDITRLIHRIFREQKGDLASWDGGGSYFVFDEHEHIVDMIEILLRVVGGRVDSLKIVIDGNDPKTQQSLAATMVDHLSGLIDEFKDSCKNFSPDTDDETIQRRTDSLNLLRIKLQCYTDVLQDQATRIQQELEAADQDMARRLISGLVPENVPTRNDVLAEAASQPYLRLDELLALYTS